MEREDKIFARDASTAANVLLHGKWKVHILCAIRGGPVRFGQLVRTVRGASKKGLTKALRDLENDGLVSRRDLSTTVLHTEYELTREKKYDVLELLNHLADWGAGYRNDQRKITSIELNALVSSAESGRSKSQLMSDGASEDSPVAPRTC